MPRSLHLERGFAFLRPGVDEREHIRVEDSTVFPLAARLLSEAEKSAIAEEMAARRKVSMLGIDPTKPGR
jgi:hypothetical protein